MKYRLLISIAWLIGSVVGYAELSSQTRFVIPDTTVDFKKYIHVEECIATFSRSSALDSIKSPIWIDTINMDYYRGTTSLPDSVITDLRKCLDNINLDTVRFSVLGTYANLLLSANRDDDLDKLILRYVDSIRAEPSKSTFRSLLFAYSNARPVRLDKFTRLYELGLAEIPTDSLPTALFLRTMALLTNFRVGNHDLAMKFAEEMITLLDTLPARLRTVKVEETIKIMAFPWVKMLMPQEAIDSLAVSSLAYRNYLLGITKKMLGVEWPEGVGDVAAEIPEPQGHFWFSNENPEGSARKISPKQVIKKGEVTAIFFLDAGCHVAQVSVKYGRQNGSKLGCYSEIHKINKIKQQYPQINIVVVSNTFGSFAVGPTLTPEQEADTLSDYYLNFSKIKGTHIVYQTEFFRLRSPDDRRIDIPTENHLNFTISKASLAGHKTVLLIDEEGRLFSYPSLFGQNEHSGDIKIKTVFDRINRKAAANKNKTSEVVAASKE